MSTRQDTKWDKMESKKKKAPILIFGGTGHYGRHIVGSLLGREQAVRVLSRNEANARRILGDGAEIVEGDITSKRSVVEALQGVEAAVISVSAFTPKLIRRLRLIERDSVLMALEEVQKAGISRVVFLSAYELRPALIEELDLEFGRVKLKIETALAQSDLNWTVLGEAPSMEVFFAMIRGEKMIVPGGGPPALPTVSPVDTGEIAAQTVLRKDLGGRRIRVTGPEAISFPEAARRISAVTGKRLEFQKIPLFALWVASLVARPFNPYLWHLVGSAKLMNRFPQDLAAQVPQDHRWLVDTFDYTPITLEMEARRRYAS
jgi:uncharacterized protein YbjT (DUF2867 family)